MTQKQPDKQIGELVNQARELRAELHKKLNDVDEQFGDLDGVLVKLELYNDPNTVTPKDYGV